MSSKGGRPAHKPTQDSRKTVALLASLGHDQDTIARVLHIVKNTLIKNYREELDNGKAITTSAVVKSAYRQAISGKVPAMTMFWLKCRAGWREKDDSQAIVTQDQIRAIIAEYTAQLGKEQ